MIALTALRVGAYRLVMAWRRRGVLTRSLAIVGDPDAARRLIAHIRLSSDEGAVIAGIFTDRLGASGDAIEGVPILGTMDRLVDYAQCHPVHEVLVALPPGGFDGAGAIMRRIRALPVSVRLYPDLVDPEVPVRGFSLLGGLPMLDVYERPLAGWNVIVKTASDWLLALLILIIMSPVMAVIALAIKLDSPGPVLFRQRRFGFNGNEFTALKFRSMRVEAGNVEGGAQATRGDPRVTPVGRFLRRTSLDELPQLFNVIGGEMSLIGPRPHAVAHDRHYADIIDGYLGRHRVRPGITGWSQVNGLRGETDTLEKMRMRVQYDLYYIDNWSLLLDLKILLLTPFVTLIGRNAY
jgi:putative colanic acid biosynthesis UDP-glucose lipid carrier transferase